MASSLVGVMVSTSGGCPWSFLVESSAISFANNDRRNDSVFHLLVPIIREHKTVLQDKLIQTNQNMQTRRMHTIVGVASFPGSPHTQINKAMGMGLQHCSTYLHGFARLASKGGGTMMGARGVNKQGR